MIQLMITGLAAKMCCEPLGNSWDISSSVSANSEPNSPTSVENLCSLPSASFFEEREHASLVIGNRHWPFFYSEAVPARYNSFGHAKTRPGGIWRDGFEELIGSSRRTVGFSLLASAIRSFV